MFKNIFNYLLLAFTAFIILKLIFNFNVLNFDYFLLVLIALFIIFKILKKRL